MGRLTARLASRNEHKLRELRAALPEWELGLLDVERYPPESGRSYLENARAKAAFGRACAGSAEWVLGEDSGLEVEALGGGPGIESARWADGEHVERVLAALAGVGLKAFLDGPELSDLSGLDGLEARPHGAAEVDLGPKDDHVRHHVEPDEQERGTAERLERERVL